MSPYIIIAVAAISFGGGCFVTHKFEEAAQAKLLAAQIVADDKKNADIEAKAATVETQLAAERVNSIKLQQQWEIERAKVHPACNLPAGTVKLLKAATSGNNLSR